MRTGRFMMLIRIIPARAGFTVCGSAHGGHAWDHPRSRGVYGLNGRSDLSQCGSSPLARGLLPRINLNIVLLRIIPARAGFTIGGPPVML